MILKAMKPRRAIIAPNRAEIEAILAEFTGEIEQVPPAFSAIRIKGERAYDLAREGREVKLAARSVTIHELHLIEMPDADHAVFEALTGKGTYVRSLVRDMANLLGTKAHVAALRRTAVGPFTEEMAVPFEDLQGAPVTTDIDRADLVQADLDAQLHPIDAGLVDLPAASISGAEAARLRRGQEVILAPPVAKGVRGPNAGIVPAVLASAHDEPVAICTLDGLKLKPNKVFVLS